MNELPENELQINMRIFGEPARMILELQKRGLIKDYSDEGYSANASLRTSISRQRQCFIESYGSYAEWKP